MIHRTNRLPLPLQNLASRGLDRLPDRCPSLARIAVDLALRITAKVIAIDAKAMAVSESPRTGQDRLSLKSRRWRPSSDLMGNDTLEIALQRHLLEKCPTPVRIRLQSERAAHHTAPPAQTIRRFQHQGPLKGLRTIRTFQIRTDHVGDGLTPRARHHSVKRWCLIRNPHLPLTGMGHQRIDPSRTPTGRDAIRRLKTGVRTRHQTRHLDGLEKRLQTPADQKSRILGKRCCRGRS